MVAMSAATGHVLATGRLTVGLVWPLAGTLALAAAAVLVNQVQDRHLDARMDRTRSRPLPTGALSPGQATAAAAMLGLGGLGLLAVGGRPVVPVLGVVAFLGYNGVYTPLKRSSSLALLPGAVVGAIPPAIGWTAAGGELIAPPLCAVMLFLFLWQVPHAWLVHLSYPRDCLSAGLPSLEIALGRDGLGRLTFRWLAAAAASTLIFPLVGLTPSLPAYLLLLAAAVWLLYRALSLLGRDADARRARWLARRVNAFAALTFILLILATAPIR
jgi:protoheme IX farnesyltransferase